MFDIFFDKNIKPVSEGCKSKSEGCKSEGYKSKSEGCKSEGCKSKSEGCKSEGCKSKSDESCDVSKIKRRSVKEFRADRQKEIEKVLENERISSIKNKKTSANFKNENGLESEEEGFLKDAKCKAKKQKNKLMKKLKAKKDTKKALVAECIYKMFDESMGMTLN